MNCFNIEIKKDKNFIGNGIYKFNKKERKIIEFYKYNSNINNQELEEFELKENECLIKIINNKIECLKNKNAK